MKIKKDYVIKQIGKELVIVPVKDEAIRFNGIITVNKTGAFLFEQLQNEDLNEEMLIEKVLEKYDVEEKIVKKDILDFIKICQEHSLIEEE
jgi:hypothetical protein